jgi:hypothetical protein
MDGVFILDVLRALPVDGLYDFALRYYAQYPALSLGYRPPGFPLVEAVFNAVLGVNVWSSRLAILPFAVVGILAWYRLVHRIFDDATAFWATLLLVTTPFLVQWGWYTMNDLPVLFLAMLLADLFHLSTASPARRYVYGSALVFVLAVWTKQTAVFLVLWLLLYLVATRGLRAYLARREVWLALGLAAVSLAPLVMLTLWLGEFNIVQSIGVGATANPYWRVHWRTLAHYPATLMREQIPVPVLLLSLVGLGAAFRRRDRRAVYFVLLIASTYAFFTYLVAKDWRYTMFWLPAFTLFAAVPLSYLAGRPRRRILYASLLGALSVIQVTRVYGITPDHATGYAEAAHWAVDHRESDTVFFDGINNGSFTYFVRALDRGRSLFVLRGDKLLSSSGLSKASRLQVHARSRQDIHDILDRYGVVHIVVERDERSSVGIHHELRDFLRTGPFDLVQEIPVHTTRPELKDQTLQIYRYRTPKTRSARQLELRVPLAGRTFAVPIQPGGSP